MISLLYPKEEKRKLTELLFTLQKLRLNDKMSASEKNTCMCSASDECCSCAGFAHDIMYAGSEKCRHIRNSSRLFTGRKGNTHGKKSSDQVFHETIHAVPGF